MVLLLLSGCINFDDDHYASVEEFETEISTWGVIGKSKPDANKITRLKGFNCDDDFCYKDLPGLVCNQRLRIYFETSLSGVVKGYRAWQIDGKFPTQCL